MIVRPVACKSILFIKYLMICLYNVKWVSTHRSGCSTCFIFGPKMRPTNSPKLTTPIHKAPRPKAESLLCYVEINMRIQSSQRQPISALLQDFISEKPLDCWNARRDRAEMSHRRRAYSNFYLISLILSRIL